MDFGEYSYFNLCCAVTRLGFCLQRSSDDFLQTKLGIGFAQLKLMIVINKNLSLEQNNLAKFLGQTEASISRQIKIMKSSGLINIAKDAKDSRKKFISLTGQGRVLLGESVKLLDKFHADFLSSISEKDRTFLQSIIDKLITNYSG